MLAKNLSAAERDELRIEKEREAKKVEMIRKQLAVFKGQKSKTSPYDLKPGPAARIEVDLTHFLTEQGQQAPLGQDVKI